MNRLKSCGARESEELIITEGFADGHPRLLTWKSLVEIKVDSVKPRRAKGSFR
ncbi:MAG: hypothetical protein IKL83_06010 [Muribaculaceae bacterium]|nr:hypothetical protein [Muribaculaceae bacterium]